MKRSSIHEEVCALMWQDIDFERNLFEIRRSMTMAGGQLLIDEPKTKSSYRNRIVIPKEAFHQWLNGSS